ncbi:MAG: hypothetical protein ABI472_13865 [Ginsengibacter sp.]
MSLQLKKTGLYNDWLSFAANQSIVECDFFDLKEGPVNELLGDFSSERLTAFGEHASGSLLSFYSKIADANVNEVPVAWLDSEGAPCIVVSNNLQDFFSILPYGMGFIYSVASVIENNLNEADLLAKTKQRITQNADELLETSKKRFLDVDDLLTWLNSKNIKLSSDPVTAIVEAHERNSDLTSWIVEKLI